MLKGSCLCGRIQYEAGDLLGPIGHCHCKTCRKAHGAAFATTSRVKRNSFRWRSGEELLGSFESTPGKRRHFCTNCGTHMMAEWVGEDTVILRLGSLDTDPGKKPQGHIWTAHDVPWLAYGSDLPHFETTPDATEKDT